MRNIVITHRTYPLPGGASVFMGHLISKLSDRFRFRVISFHTGEGITQVKTRHKSNYLKHLSYYFNSFKALYWIRKKEGKGGIDIIMNMGTGALGGALFGKIYKIPTLTRLSGTRMTLYKQRDDKGISGKLGRYLYWRILIPEFLGYYLSDIIVVPTEHSKKALIDAYPYLKSRVQVVMEGARIDGPHSTPDEILKKYRVLRDRNVILFNTYTTSPSVFNESLLQIMEKIPGAIVVAIEAHEVKIHTPDDVIKTDIRAKDALQIGDILVCAPPIEEHSTLTLESIFLDVPVIAPSIGWFNEVFEGYPRFLFGGVSCGAITSKLLEFYENRDEFLRQTREIKKELLERYDIKRTIGEYENLFEDMSHCNLQG